ncbi:cytochrome P450 [Streptomyces sp. IMTB 2501]|uniref:cytochrome P450 n=1 Tax=Streptomyces sp. IMTB 2501 TaxID=1776340 RepID=UPI000D1A465C|nr:cytochrome P450 [Streptomyces sp. IMTB 2501]
MLDTAPQLCAGLFRHARYVIAVDGPDAFDSASTHEIPDVAFVARRCTRTPERFAEALVHEFVHQRLYDLQMTRSVCGERLRHGDVVCVNLASANRDERRWERADRFDPHRQPQPHLAMGNGPHVCLGRLLAALKARVSSTHSPHRGRTTSWTPRS